MSRVFRSVQRRFPSCSLESVLVTLLAVGAILALSGLLRPEAGATVSPVADSDGDGLLDIEENDLYSTDPDDPDSDDDGYDDGWEIEISSDPNDALSPYDPAQIQPDQSDFDGDGVSNEDEMLVHFTDPAVADSDRDGFDDGEELLLLGSDPLDPADPPDDEPSADEDGDDDDDPAPSDDSVQWGDLNSADGIAASYPIDGGSALTKTATANAWDTAVVAPVPAFGGTHLEFRFATTSKNAVVGLSSRNSVNGLDTIDYAVYARSNGYAYVYENGAYRANLGTYGAEDLFSVDRVGNEIRYLKNGEVKYVSTLGSSTPLRASAALYSAGSEIVDLRMTGGYADNTLDTDLDDLPDAWEQQIVDAYPGLYPDIDAVAPTDDPDGDGLSNLEEYRQHSDPTDLASPLDMSGLGALGVFAAVEWSDQQASTASYPPNLGSTLRKDTLGNTWDASALGASSVPAFGDTRLQFRFPGGTKRIAAGLSDRRSDQASPRSSGIHYAIQSQGNGYAYVYENGAYRANLGTFGAEDLFAVERVGEQIRYLKNDEPVYTSTAASRAPLFADTALFTPGSEIVDARMSGLDRDGIVDADGDLLRDDWEQDIVNAYPGVYADESAVQPEDDPDIDGLSNAEEQEQGSSPADSASPGTGSDSGLFYPVDWSQNIDSVSSTAAGTGTGTGTGEEPTAGRGSTLEKTAVAAAWNAGAVSTAFIPADADTALRFRFPTSDKRLAIGLSEGEVPGDDGSGSSEGNGDGDGDGGDEGSSEVIGASPGLDLAGISYAVQAQSNGHAYVYENGAYKAALGKYGAEDVFTVRRNSGIVSYWKNGEVVFSSAQPSSGPLFAEAAQHTSGARVVDARMGRTPPMVDDEGDGAGDGDGDGTSGGSGGGGGNPDDSGGQDNDEDNGSSGPVNYLQGGDFGNESLSLTRGSASTLEWDLVTIGGWEGLVEVQRDGDRQYAELDAHNGVTGLKQSVELPPGTYILTWEHAPRDHELAGDNAYEVDVSVDGASVLDAPYSHSWPELSDTVWTRAVLVFQVSAAEAEGEENAPRSVTVQFASTGNQNTYGTYIDNVDLLPVEIVVPQEGSTAVGFVEEELVATSELKVAKWENAFDDPTGTPTLKSDFNDRDVDRFYLKVPMPWKSGEGTAKVKIKTDSDPENEIEVTEIPGEPGVFRTEALILVSNDTDDDPDDKYPEDGADEGLDDVTHKVKLGDDVTFTIDAPSGPVTVTVPVPAKGKVKITSWLYDTPVVRKRADLDRAIEIAGELFAQIGLEVDHDVKEVPFPIEAELATDQGKLELIEYDHWEYDEVLEEDIFYKYADLTEEGKNFMETQSSPGRLDLYFIYSLINEPISTAGLAMTERFLVNLPLSTDPIGYAMTYSDKAFMLDGVISDPQVGYGGFQDVEFIVTHEALHLIGVLDHSPVKNNLMYHKADKWKSEVTDQRRLSSDQEDDVFSVQRVTIELFSD